MKILSIETSCDETAIALLDITGSPTRPEIKVLSNALLSQVALHEQYGGVYPNLAKREHIKNLPILLDKVLAEVSSKEQEVIIPESIDYIAVTHGPGLEPALWTGITFAENLGKKWSKPVIPVNHMEGHIFSVLYGESGELEFPALALLVSGGHTELVFAEGIGKYEILGHTVDDAVGEAFDKVARMLGLSYPGGPKISLLAEKSRIRNKESGIIFPRPMIHSKDLNFSYSGLKTAVLYKLKALGEISDESREDVARAFEDAAIDVLIEKTHTALMENSETKTLIVAGGVSANNYLREKLNLLISEFPEVKLRIPEKALTTDNAIMIGIAAYARLLSDESLSESAITASGNLSLE